MTVVAVDFGASSIRVCRVDLDRRPFAVEVVHRYAHGPVRHAGGSLRWDWDRLMIETERGLDAARALGPVDSIGVDTWGVDYGLVDENGMLIGPPHSYRSHRTAGYRSVLDAIGARRLYEIAGLQVQPFNTIFQLAVHEPRELDRAAHALLLPDLIVHHLTGWIGTERSIAGTTALLDLGSGAWSQEMFDAIGVRADLFPPVTAAARVVGEWNGIPVALVGGHDTASAVAAMGSVRGSVGFVASGTWLLVGREQVEPDVSFAAEALHFSNEQGVCGGIRFLRNVAGYWMLNECCRQWGLDPEGVVARAQALAPAEHVVDATDERFLAPDDMVAEIISAAGLPADATPPVVARCIIESMAATSATVLSHLQPLDEVALFGGGALQILRERLEARIRLPVRTGPSEAAALGNALVQGIALGHFADLDDARGQL